jgi:hypothetical protein
MMHSSLIIGRQVRWWYVRSRVVTMLYLENVSDSVVDGVE